MLAILNEQRVQIVNAYPLFTIHIDVLFMDIYSFGLNEEYYQTEYINIYSILINNENDIIIIKNQFIGNECKCYTCRQVNIAYGIN